MTTRAEAKQQTREALILAAMELFREQGLDGPSLDAICERAGKTRGAFYVHFDDREALQAAVMEEILTAYVASIVTTAQPEGDLVRSIEAFIGHVMEVARGGSRSPIGVLGPDQLRLLLGGIHRSTLVRERFRMLVGLAFDQLVAVIEAGQRGGTVRSDVDPGALARVLIGQVFGLMALLESMPPSEAAVEQMFHAVRTLVQPPG